MEITEVRIKLMDDTDDRLAAFCSITFDHCFVVRDLKIITGANGLFVAMPSRKLTAHCPRCGCKNHLRAPYCNQCGAKLKDELVIRDHEGRTKLYADIAHPINSQCREMIQNRVIAEFEAELERAKQPGYVSRYDEGYDLDAGEEGDLPEAPMPRETRSAPAGSRSKIEPPASEPRPPHRPQGSRSRGTPPPGESRRARRRPPEGDSFGEGIL